MTVAISRKERIIFLTLYASVLYIDLNPLNNTHLAPLRRVTISLERLSGFFILGTPFFLWLTKFFNKKQVPIPFFLIPIPEDSPETILRLFVSGSLERGYWNRQRFCAQASSIERDRK